MEEIKEWKVGSGYITLHCETLESARMNARGISYTQPFATITKVLKSGGEFQTERWEKGECVWIMKD